MQMNVRTVESFCTGFRNFPATIGSGFYCNRPQVTSYFDGFLLH